MEEEGSGEHEEGEDHGDECARRGNLWICMGGRLELPGEDLDTILKVYPGDVEAECVTRKKGDVFEEVAP